MAEKRFYNLKNTAKQIDDALTDIVDIMESEQYDIPIVLKKANISNNKERDFLGFGTISGGIINSEKNAFIMGDGEDWAAGGDFKGLSVLSNNSVSELNEYFITVPSQNSVLYIGGGGSIEDGEPETEIIINAETGMEEDVVNFKYELDGDYYIKIADNAKINFLNSSELMLNDWANIKIGEKARPFSIFNTEYHSPFIRIKNATYFVSDVGNTQSGPPIFIFHGGSYFDVSDAQAYNTHKRLKDPSDIGNTSQIDSSSYGNNNYYPDCPWTSNGTWYNQTGTIFHLHESSSIIMDGAPVLHMRDYAVALMEGDSRFRMRGGTLGSTKRTTFEMNHGTHFKMNSGNADVVLTLNDKQFYFGQQNNPNANDLGSDDNIMSCFDTQRYPWLFHRNAVAKWASGGGGPRNTLSSWEPNLYLGCGPAILYCTEGNGSLITDIVVKNNSQMLIGKHTNANSTLNETIDVDENSTLIIKHGTDNGAKYVADITCDPYSNTLIKLGADEYANFTVAITPSGEAGIQFSPSGDFTLNYEPHEVYRNYFHPDYYYEFTDGNIFKQFNGAAHLELQDGSGIIMRKSQRDGSSGGLKQYWSSQNPIIITTTTDYTGQSMTEFMENTDDFNNFKAAAVKILGDTTLIYDIEYISGGVISSEQNQETSTYKTSIYNFYYYYKAGHNNSRWNCPIQSYLSSNAPKFQLYNNSNFLMKGIEQTNKETYIFTIRKEDFPELFEQSSFTISSLDDINQIILTMSEISYYNATINEISSIENRGYQGIIRDTLINYGTAGEETREVKLTWTIAYYGDEVLPSTTLDRSINSPTVEFDDSSYLYMNGKSEIVMENNCIIHSHVNLNSSSPNYGEIEYVFGDGNNAEEQVVITINQLKQLLALLN